MRTLSSISILAAGLCLPLPAPGAADLDALRAAADQGDPAAQSSLGVALLHGAGVERDYKSAVTWIVAAAQAGDPLGRTWLGELYRTGLVLPYDVEAGYRISLEAAIDDVPAAQFAVGECYRFGRGVLPHPGKAATWYARATQALDQEPESLDAASAFAIGLCLRDGRGTPRNLRRAARWLFAAGMAGHPHALFELGNFYAHGLGVEQDLTKAVGIYAKAVEAGSVQACLALARHTGLGVGDTPPDPDTARAWSQQAQDLLLERATLGSMVDATDLYLLLYRGAFFPAKPEAALRWLKAAARKQYPPALALLGRHLATGDGMEKDPRKALVVLKRAADLHDPEANFLLWQLYRSGDGIERDMDRAIVALQQAAALGNITAMNTLAEWYRLYVQSPTAAAQAQHWYEQALDGYLALAERGEVSAMASLVVLYGRGRGTPKDIAESMRWLTAAAERDWTQAQFMLANAYEKGLGIERDPAQALAWYTRAATRDSVPAMLTLAAAYEQGALDLPPDLETAEQWYTKAYAIADDAAASGDDPDAAYFLSSLIMSGIGTERDVDQAIAWLTRAAEAGHDVAQLDLATMYLRGDNVEMNIDTAVSWYRRAAKQGSADAQYILGRAYDNGEGVDQDYIEAYIWYSLAALQKHRKALVLRDELGVTLSDQDIFLAKQRIAQELEEAQPILTRDGILGGSPFTPPAL